MMTQIVKSLLILILISSSMSGIIFLFYPYLTTFIKVFIATTGIQIFFFLLYNNILRYIARLSLEKDALQLSQLAETNRIFAQCQSCKAMNNVSVTLSEENEFECDECAAPNKIIIDISTVVPTKPIYDK